MEADPSNTVLASWTQTERGQVRVLPAEADIVRLNTDPEIIDSFRTNPQARLAPIYIPPADERTAYGDVIIPAESEFITSQLPVGLSGDLYVIHDGRETRFCGVNSAPIQGLSAISIAWRADAHEGVDEALLQSWLDAGTVTVEYRPSQQIAEKSHDIREILGISLRFTGVPVTDTKTPRTAIGMDPADTDTIARPHNDADDATDG
ncbi:MAG: hypothetical protein WD114_03920 [Phycisphaerales bacterium]